MRIGQIAGNFPSLKSSAGMELVAYNLAREFSKNNSIYVFTRANQFDIQKIDGITFFYTDGSSTEFEKFITECKPDILHYHTIKGLSPKIFEVGRNKKIPSCITLHDFWLFCPAVHLLGNYNKICDGPNGGTKCAYCARGVRNISKGYEIYKDRAYPQLLKDFIFSRKAYKDLFKFRFSEYKRLSNLIDIPVSPSRSFKKIYEDLDFFKNKIRLIDNGVPERTFIQERRVSDTIRFGYIGSIANHKGVDILIRAFKRVKNSKLSLYIYGAKRDFNFYYEKIKFLIKDDKRIELRGAFLNDEIEKIHSEIDVLVIPSICYENSPLTLKEAYYSSIPVVASRLGGLIEYVEDGVTGILFSAGNIDELSKIILELSIQPEKIENMSKKIEKGNYKKSIGECARDYLDLYKILLG